MNKKRIIFVIFMILIILSSVTFIYTELTKANIKLIEQKSGSQAIVGITVTNNDINQNSQDGVS